MNTYAQEQDTNKSAFREGPIARRIERRTAKLPSDLFLWAAGAAIVTSLTFEVIGMMRGERRGVLGRFRQARSSEPLAGFIGMWVPSLLLLGVYNKIVKVAGSDRMDSGLGSSRER